MGPLDIIIPLGKSPHNFWELRYALRSMYQYLPHKDLYIVGERPTWLQNAIHIPAVDVRLKHRSILQKVARACQGEEDFIFANDDHFITQLVTELPDYYDSTVADWRQRNMGSFYGACIANTTPGFYYDIHVPMIANKAIWREWAAEDWGKDHLVKSTYKHRYGANPKPMKDCKIRDNVIPSGPFFSTPEKLLPELMNKIAELYPYASKYERN